MLCLASNSVLPPPQRWGALGTGMTSNLEAED